MKRSRPFLVRLATTLLMLNLGVVGLVLLSTLQSKENYEVKARISAENLTRLLSENISNVFLRVDLALLTTADELERQSLLGGISGSSVANFMLRQHKRLPEYDGMRFSDEAGIVRYGSGLENGNSISISDRDYFVQLRDRNDAGLVISKPVLGRISRKWVVIAGRRFNKSDGSFGGVVYASVLLSQFQDMFAALAIGANGVISFMDSDLAMVARYPLLNEANNSSGIQTSSPEFRNSLLTNPDYGCYAALTRLDGINRTFCYRRMVVYPGYIIVGLGTDDYLVEWKAEARKKILLAALFCLATGAGGLLLWKSWRQRELDIAAIKSSQQSLHDAQKISSLGQYSYNIQADRWESSDILDAIFGIDGDFVRDGQHWLSLIVAEDRQEMREYLKNVFDSRLPFERKYRIIRASDGQGRWVHGKGHVLVDPAGIPLTLVGTVQDITESKTAELALQASEGRLKAIFDASPDACIIVDEHGTINMTNWQVERLLGYKAEELVGQAVEMLVPFPFRANHTTLRKGFSDAMETRFMGQGREINVLKKDGSKCGAEINLSCVVTQQGTFIACSLRDTSERKKAEETTRIMGRVFSNSNEALMITDAENRIIAVNSVFSRLTGYEHDEIVGQNPRILSAGNVPADTYERMWESLRTMGMWEGELQDRRKTGEIFPKWLSISVVRDESGVLTNYIGSFVDITERKASEERIRHLAYHDPLTNLPNRFSLHERLTQAIGLAERGKRNLALMLIDLDNFKTINDTLGHLTGDQLLVQVGQRLIACVRQSDIVARLGGDEFVIVLPDIDSPADAAYVADKILMVISTPYLVDGKELRTSPSVGIALYPDDALDGQGLTKNADLAMYHAKSKGRGNYQFFKDEMQTVTVRRLAMETDLRTALAREEFLLHYQPQLDLRSGQLVGVEALLRWQHPLNGLVSPLDFVPVAEECGLIIPIGDWVLREACRQLASWRTRNINHIRMSVNLSALQFADPLLPSRIQVILAEEGLPADSLDLEVTESMTMASPGDAVSIMRVLAGMNLTLSIDDFGTGYSSLAYLKMFPISTLKIDRAFVKDIEFDQSDADICDVTVLLAHKLGLQVVAEGVETEAQLKYLLSIGCEKIQGYLISKPLPSALAEEFIREYRNSRSLSLIDLWED